MQISLHCLNGVHVPVLVRPAGELGSPNSGCLELRRRPRRHAGLHAEGNTLPRHVGKGPSDSLLVFVLGSDGSISSTSVVGGKMSRKTRSRSCQVSHFLGQCGRALWYCFASLLHRSCNSQTTASKETPRPRKQHTSAPRWTCPILGYYGLLTVDCWLMASGSSLGHGLTRALSRSIANVYSYFCAQCC